MVNHNTNNRAQADREARQADSLQQRLRKQGNEIEKDGAFPEPKQPQPRLPPTTNDEKEVNKEIKFLFDIFPKTLDLAFGGLTFDIMARRRDGEKERLEFVSDDDAALNLKECLDFGDNLPSNAARLCKLTRELFRIAADLKNKGYWPGLTGTRADYIRFCNGIAAFLTAGGLEAGGFSAKGFSDAYRNKLPLIKGATIMDVLQNVGLARRRWRCALRDELSDQKRQEMVGSLTKAQEDMGAFVDTWNALLDEDIIRSKAAVKALRESRIKTSDLALRPLAPEMCTFGMGGLSMKEERDEA
ncbi:hypothetical protein ACHAQA_005078 [Verticillium albo-atrum]